MEWVHVTAETRQDAIDKALDNLGVDESEAEIDVVEEKASGLFGFKKGSVSLRARVKPRATRPKIERGRGRRRKGEGNGGGRNGGGSGGGKGSNGDRSTEGGAEGQGQDRSGRSRNRRRRSRGSGGGGEGATAANPTASNKPETTATKAASDATDANDGNGGNGPKKKAKSKAGGRDRAKNGDGSGGSKNRRDQAPDEEASMEEVAAQLKTFLGGLTEAFGYDGPVTVADDGDGGLLAAVEGRHGLMVGPKGRTLDAIQELTRVSAQRTVPSSIRIRVDVGGYRSVRADALKGFATEAAEAALADGKERSLEPMNSADRKIVHDVLNDIDGVETRSAGVEPRRRVVIVPVDTTPDEPVGDEPAGDEGDDVDEPIDEAAAEAADTDTDTDEAEAATVS